jgi:hypothetical protein
MVVFISGATGKRRARRRTPVQHHAKPAADAIAGPFETGRDRHAALPDRHPRAFYRNASPASFHRNEPSGDRSEGEMRAGQNPIPHPIPPAPVAPSPVIPMTDRVDAPDRLSETDRHQAAVDFIIDAIGQIRQSEFTPPSSLRLTPPPQTANQFCLFLKPWTTNPGVRLRALLDFVFASAASHGLAVEELAVLPGAYLRRRQTMQEHYWRMNLFARTGARSFPDSARAAFREAFGTEAKDEIVLGGFEFLERFKTVSPLALELIWENVQQHRLGNSISCARITVGNESLFLVNGFVPNLMETYGLPHSVVVVLSLHGPLAWRDARKLFVGQTDPAKAIEGSLRNHLYVNRNALGITDLRLGANGVHLSSGPIEALVELHRLMSLGSPDAQRSHADLQFGRKLLSIFSPQEVKAIVANPTVRFEGRSEPLFDLTEELDEDAAQTLLLGIRDQFAR